MRIYIAFQLYFWKIILGNEFRQHEASNISIVEYNHSGTENVPPSKGTHILHEPAYNVTIVVYSFMLMY